MKLDNLPEKLKKDGHFCLWKYEERNGNRTKVPYNPNRPGQRASSTDPGTFAGYDKALEVLQTVPGFDGIGAGIFGTLCAVDIDHCHKDGQLSAMGSWIIDKMGSYTELSPSGEGVRILFSVPEGFQYDDLTHYVNRRGLGADGQEGLEIYVAGSTNKFVTVTGNMIRPGRVEERAWEILEVAGRYMERPEIHAQDRPEEPTGLSDDEILHIASNAKNGEKFMQLWSGDSSGYPSESEADLALCSFLAFYTGRSADRIDELFRQSGLMRAKWDANRGGKTYGEKTAEIACRGCRSIYNPQKLRGLEPGDWSDVGQAEVYVQEYGYKIRYSKATDFLVYNGQKWDESPLDAQRLSQELTARQYKEAKKKLEEARQAYDKAVEEDPDAAGDAHKKMSACEKYRNYIIQRRGSARIKATMTEAAPMVQIRTEELDADGYLLNTPAGTVDLRTGQIRDHDPKDYCTKITAVAPDQTGTDVWQEFLDRLTSGDKDLARYLQEVVGICAIGHVKREELIIAMGSGGNGKSTFFNLLADVMGDYSGAISSEILIADSKKNKDPEIAELRGKRLVIAAELEEGMRLSTSTVKKVCSTDEIQAEKKFKDPFKFMPSHHIVLYTNHLPKVSSTDSGTWDRLVVVPFMAKFRGESGEIKDYKSVLFERCGGAVLSWIIKGAQRVILSGFLIKQPRCVLDAIEKYRGDNNWIQQFLDARCVMGPGNTAMGGELYQEYRTHCMLTGEKYVRSNADLSRALQDAGISSRKTKTGKIYAGLRIKTTAELMRDTTEANVV